MGGGSKWGYHAHTLLGDAWLTAKPGPTTLRYGGNTSCVEVPAAGGTLIVLDCGSGAYGLGQALLAEASGPRHGHLLISHTHWDHIQGFPSLPRCSCQAMSGISTARVG